MESEQADLGRVGGDKSCCAPHKGGPGTESHTLPLTQIAYESEKTS